jgi:hypothetical protein
MSLRPYLGTCLAHGQHSTSQWAHECPARMAKQRSERSRRGAETKQERRRGAVATPAIPTLPPASQRLAEDA